LFVADRLRPVAAVAAVAIVVDQTTKWWALSVLADRAPIDVVWTLRFSLVFNRGMAFSAGTSFGPVIGVVALVVTGVLIRLAARTPDLVQRVAIGAIVGGAIGNVVDRLFRGEGWMRGAVVDFIDFQWWPVFNVADMAVTCGAALLAIRAFRRAPSDS
jgi:signal peptidase II